ncbi:hypothetical protein PHYBOEH_008988 [Phytophthora boehmeriae]|uniref:Uncharacterized protein n=1 Tax=Phytophthora boehmeriae TaxID=109152 RepID=A0A8T1W0U3_9STRA|nr:hypothetical protein PHYBOEH_008988 [Phytophthora boehmeriae]
MIQFLLAITVIVDSFEESALGPMRLSQTQFTSSVLMYVLGLPTTHLPLAEVTSPKEAASLEAAETKEDELRLTIAAAVRIRRAESEKLGLEFDCMVLAEDG